MLLPANQTARCHNPLDYKHIRYRKHLPHSDPKRSRDVSDVGYSAWNTKDNYDMSASVFVVQFNGFMSFTS
jgi:hypothetical protein